MKRGIDEGFAPEELIEHAVGELKAVPEVQAVYLFGSHARGEAGPLSDIDICVVAPKDVEREKKLDMMGPCSDVLNVSIFWDLPPQIRMRVAHEGVCLFERDKAAALAAMLDSIKEYLDFRPVFMRFALRSLGAKW